LYKVFIEKVQATPYNFLIIDNYILYINNIKRKSIMGEGSTKKRSRLYGDNDEHARDYIISVMSELDQSGLSGCWCDSAQIDILKHKIAFVDIHRSLFDTVDDVSLKHDIDKLVLLGMCDCDLAREIHERYSKHHYPNMTSELCRIEYIINQESYRYTEEKTGLNGFQRILSIEPRALSLVGNNLNQLGLDTTKRRSFGKVGLFKTTSDCKVLLESTIKEIRNFKNMCFDLGIVEGTKAWNNT